MPPIVLRILTLIQAAAQYAPEAKKIWESARVVFNMWFAGGIITVAQQKALNDWSEAHEAAVLAGNVPPEFTVEADPS